jgi:hypothetical protein
MSIDTFGSPILADVGFNADGSLKQSGKQNVKFYNKKRLNFKAKRDEHGNLIIDPKTGIPAKEAYEETVEMVRIETKGDTNIIDDIADDLRKQQFYRQYKFFREGKIPDGHPIEDFDFIQAPTITELRLLGIHVLEQVAMMSDLDCERLKDQSGYELRDIATQWVKMNTPQGQMTKAKILEQEVQALKRQIQTLQERKEVYRSEVVQSEPVVEEVLETVELTPEQANKRKKRLV